MHPYFTIGLWLILGSTCGLIAHKRGRNLYLWFFVGLFFGLLGLLTLLFVTRKRRVTENTTVTVTNLEPVKPLPLPEEAQKFWYYLDKDHTL
jgi:hypothetical protein